VSGSTDQVVTLLAVLDQVMAKGQVAKPQEIRNGDLIWAWQASAALSAEIVAQAFPFALLQLLQCIAFLRMERTLLVGQQFSGGEIVSGGCSEGECRHALGE
jgi:hypothetical protein